MLADPPRQQVVYSDDEELKPEAADQKQQQNEEQEQEREKHRKRAERFKTDYVEPAAHGQRGRRRQGSAAQDGITGGIDLFSEEETARRQRRAQRFSTHEQSLTYQPEALDDEEATAERQKQQRAKRFGTEYKPLDRTGLAEADLLEERVNPDGEDLRRPEAVYLYGVDFMSTSDCLRYFEEYSAQSVEWLNDSACNVVFGDPHSAAAAIVRLGKPLPPEAAKPDEPGLDPTDVRNLPYLWHKGRPFVKDGKAIALVFRMATLADTKGNSSSRRTRRLWNLPMQQAERKAQQQRRRARPGGMEDEEGDVEMREGRERGERGGARLRRRKRRKQGLGEIDMGSAEDEEGSGDDGGPQDIQGDAPVGDLRELLSKREEAGSLFSAADAGVWPKQAEGAQSDT